MIPKTMQALVVHTLGWPNPMQVESVAVPTPGPDEVLVRVEYAGLNFADILVIQGSYQEKQALPFVPGAELCGRVVETGANVEGIQPGERVMGQVAAGAYAQYVRMHVERLARVPQEMPADAAAGFYIPYGTAHCALIDRGRLRAGETVLVLGASGAVGQAAIQVAKAAGANVIAASGGMAKRTVCMASGAQAYVDYNDGGLRERILEASGGDGIDLVFDTVGGDAALEALRCLRFEGRFVVIGFTSGTAPQFRANHVLVKNIDIIGCYWGPYQTRRIDQTRAAFARLDEWYGRGLLTPHVDARVALGEIGDALERLRTRGYAGKVVAEITSER